MQVRRLCLTVAGELRNLRLKSRFHWRNREFICRFFLGSLRRDSIMLYHYTFNVYKGKELLINREVQCFLRDIFHKISVEKGFEILECEILSDHVHMLINQSYNVSTSYVMKNIKGISSRRLFQKYDVNRYEVRKLWGRSFHVRKIDNAQKAIVSNYIKSQRTYEGIDKRH